MLEAEMDTQWGFAKHDTKNKQTENSRNGHSKKTVDSELCEMEIDVPRDRQGEFEPIIVKKHQKRMHSIEEQVIALYARGVSTSDIQAHLHQIYGIDFAWSYTWPTCTKCIIILLAATSVASLWKQKRATGYMQALRWKAGEDNMLWGFLLTVVFLSCSLVVLIISPKWRGSFHIAKLLFPILLIACFSFIANGFHQIWVSEKFSIRYNHLSQSLFIKSHNMLVLSRNEFQMCVVFCSCLFLWFVYELVRILRNRKNNL